MQTTEKTREFEEALARYCEARHDWADSQSDMAQRRVEHYIAGLMEHEGMSYADSYCELGRRKPGLFPGRPRLEDADPRDFVQERHSQLQGENPHLTGSEVERMVAEGYPAVYALAQLVRLDPVRFNTACEYTGPRARQLARRGSLAAHILSTARSARQSDEARTEVLMKEAAERQARKGGR